MPWISALCLLILFLSTYEAACKVRAAEDVSMHGNNGEECEGSFKEGESDTEMEDDAQEQLLVDFLRKSDEDSAAAFMQELEKWLEIASSSSCFNLGEFFVRRQLEEDHKASKKTSFSGAAAEESDTEESDTRNYIDELYGGVHKTGKNCGAAMLMGRRPTQEDRVVCLPELILPSLGKRGSSCRTLGFFGVFDGHNGEEASDFVSKCLHQYFLHQVYIIKGSLIAHIFSFDLSLQPFLSRMIGRTTGKGSPNALDFKYFRSLLGGNFGMNPYMKNTNPEVCSLMSPAEMDISANSPVSRNSLLNVKRSIVEDSCEMLASSCDTKASESEEFEITGVSQTNLVEICKLNLEKGIDSSTPDISERHFPEEHGELCCRNNQRMANTKVSSHDTRTYEAYRSCGVIPKSSFKAESRISGICESCFYRTLYKKALSDAIFTVDMAFDEEARKRGWEGGTTACVALIMDGHVLISNLGDSKAYFCSFPCEISSAEDLKPVMWKKHWYRRKLQHTIKSTSKITSIVPHVHTRTLCVQELTQDHHPDRKDERARIESAGGFVEEWGGVPRVNGVLAVSRSIGDLPFKRYGVICTPEYTGWKAIGNTYNYLLMASDGIFERLETQDTCRLTSALTAHKLGDEESEISWASNIRAMKHLDWYEDSSHSVEPNFLIAELPIPLPPKQLITEQHDGITEDGDLVKIDRNNMSEDNGRNAMVNRSALLKNELFKFYSRESINDSKASKAPASKHHSAGTQNLGSHNSHKLNQEGNYHEEFRENLMSGGNNRLDVSDPNLIAQMIVEMAHTMGSQDNLAVVIIPLEGLHFQPSVNSVEQPHYKSEVLNGIMFQHEHTAELVITEHFKNISNELSYSVVDHNTTSLGGSFGMQLDLKVKGMTQDDGFPLVLVSGMLVEKQCHSCYELMERLSGDVVLPLRDGIETEFSTEKGRSDTKERRNGILMHLGGSNKQIKIYEDHQLWIHRILQTEVARGILAKGTSACQLLSLVGSLQPDAQTVSSTQLDEAPSYVVHHKRYILKKNVAHGGFGEIWLALRKRCSSNEDVETLNTESTDEGLHATSKSTLSSETSSSYCEGKTAWIHDITPNVEGVQKNDADDVYILKRILDVQQFKFCNNLMCNKFLCKGCCCSLQLFGLMKGNSGISLSGLREKYFGEVFMNASIQQANKLSAASLQEHGYCFISKHYSWTKKFHTSSPVATNYSYCVDEQKLKDLENHTRYEQSLRINQEEGLNHIARFVDSFEIQHQSELWLVFRMEGKSLSSLLYDSEGTVGHPGDSVSFKVLEPSSWWRWMKTTKAGKEEYRNLLKQMMLALQTCHRHNITHRDIKPENMVVLVGGSQMPNALNRNLKMDWPYNLTLRLIDFGSALDPFTIEHLYGTTGPSEKEQTVEYSPPEVLLWKHWLHLHYHQAYAYDMWSAGVVMLELVLGTPHVFQVSSRTRALLDRHLEEWDEASKKIAYMLRAFMEMCIFLPGVRPHHSRAEPFKYSEKFGLASWDCTEEALLQQIKQRDPLKIGMPDVWSLRLLRQLLQWYPEDRISAEDALQHPFFHPSRQSTKNFT